MQAFAPKSRRPKFDLTLKIFDLNNVPLVSGTSFVKWQLSSHSAAEHSGRTPKCQIRDHKVSYDYEKTLAVRLTIDRQGMLQESWISFEVVQEYAASARGERIVLGNIRLNLAEYVDALEASEEDGVCRRYLMQDSRINSTLKIGIQMRQTEGEQNYSAPPLKSAAVFGGIAGIIAGEQAELDDSGYVPTLNTKSKEHHEYQDMYRANLAAYWAAQPGELRADECIEDIFAGGYGWAKHDEPNHPSNMRDQDNRPRSSHKMSRHGDFSHAAEAFSTKSSSSGKAALGTGASNANGRSSLEQHADSFKAEVAATSPHKSHEVDELLIREDLKSWKLPSDRAALAEEKLSA